VFYIGSIVKAKINNNKKLIKSLFKNAKRSVKLAVVPHKNNDYRPHLVRRYGLVAISFIVIGLQLGYNGATTGSVLGRESDISISSLLDQTNKMRVQAGVPELKINDKLNKAAYLKAKDMFADQYWAHNAPDGTEPWKWFGDVEYNYNEAGENLAKNFTSTSAVMTAWMNSPEHKTNVLKNNYEDAGFAIVSGELNGEPTSLIVALYGQPAVSSVVGAQAAFAKPESAGQGSITTQFAVAIQSMTPAVLIGLFLIAFAAMISILAHAHRNKMPKTLRHSWYRHHGAYKTIGMLSFGLIVLLLSGGGQI
jgi:hypothetical protein